MVAAGSLNLAAACLNWYERMFAAGSLNLAAACLNWYDEQNICVDFKKDLLYKKRNW